MGLKERISRGEVAVMPANTGRHANHFVMPANAGIHANHFVIPAKAGIHANHFVIPAKAGIQCWRAMVVAEWPGPGFPLSRA